MKRRINYTDRKRIPGERVSLNLIEHDGQKSFDANLNLDGLGLANHACIYLESYHKTDYMRYAFGTVEHIQKPQNTDLGFLGRIENLRFRLKIVDESGDRGLILAVADRIRPEGADEIRSILTVEFKDLGHQVWRVSFDGNEPILELNSTVPFIRDKAKADYRLFFYVYPAVIREILTNMILIDGIPDLDDAEEWEQDWMGFAYRYGGEYPEILDRSQDGFDENEIRGWVERVVTEFCISHRDKWHDFIQLEDTGEQ